jgi:hypothetical protein
MDRVQTDTRLPHDFSVCHLSSVFCILISVFRPLPSVFYIIDKSVHLRYSMQSETTAEPLLKGETLPCVKDSVNCAAGANGKKRP